MAVKFSPEQEKILRSVQRFAKSKRVRLYLVGGILRDALLGREDKSPDFDFCLKRGAVNFGRKLAGSMGAGFVVLDKEHGASRLVKKTARGFLTLDFADFRGASLEIDLLHRDFTINSLAAELEDIVSQDNLSGSLIDPHGAQRDLKAKVIRVISRESFSEDPLRILRAFSLSSRLRFIIDKETRRLAEKQKEGLRKVSAERIRDELFKILAAKDSHDFIVALDRSKILELIFPELLPLRGIGQGPYHHLDVWGHSLETLKQTDILLEELRGHREIKSYLALCLCAQRNRGQTLKLAALLHDLGKPATMRRQDRKITFHGHERVGAGIMAEIGRRLKLSGEELGSLRRIILCHLRPGFLSDLKVLTARAKFRFFRDAGEEAINVLLLSVADQRATKGRLATPASRRRQEKTAFTLAREYFRRQKEEKPARLVNGDELMSRFKLGPSPLIGKILSGLEEF